MAEKYVPPAYQEDGFHCPHCGYYAHQRFTREFIACFPTGSNLDLNRGDVCAASLCQKCNRVCIWHGKKLVVPRVVLGPPPHDDLPAEPKADYEEARSIAADSPRAAAALLRLSLQKLCRALGEPGKDINTDIGSLVKKGLPARIQQALDILRVVGNECVHPGTMDLRDDVETVGKLFALVNLIVQDRITEPKEIDKLYGSLPPEKRKGIEDRDKKARP
jgi:hypothetical protein